MEGQRKREMEGVVGRIIHPLLKHPSPRTCEYVTLYDKRDFTDMIKLKILKWREIFWIIWESPT